MKAERFIVTTRKNGRSRQVIWSNAEPLALDHPVSWRLEQGACGLRIVGKDREIPIPTESLAQGSRTVELSGPGPGLSVTLRKASELRPAYALRAAPADGAESRLCVSHGSRESLLSFEEMGSRHVGRAERSRLFILRKVRNGYRIIPKADDLRVELGEEAPEPVSRGEGMILDEEDLLRARFLWGQHWWRVTRVPVPQLLVTLDRQESEINQERAWFRALSRNLALGAAGLVVAAALFLSLQDRRASEAGDPVQPSGPIVSLKKPKLFPVALEPEAPPAAPKSAPALTHEENVALKAAPSVESSPPVAAARIIPDARPENELPPPAPARVAGTPNHRLRSGGGGHLRHPSQSRHPGESYALGTVLTSKGIIVSGDGKLSSSEVERTLAVHLDSFEGCYDGALARNPHLSGPVLVQWVIDPHGKVHDTRIVRSRIRSPALLQCLIGRIEKLRFDRPRGGSVLVRYPFAFSVTKI